MSFWHDMKAKPKLCEAMHSGIATSPSCNTVVTTTLDGASWHHIAVFVTVLRG